MRHDRAPYIVLFALAICVVCGILVSTAAVSWASAQKANKELDRKRNVLEAAGFIEPGEPVTAEEVEQYFGNIEEVAYDLQEQHEAPDFSLVGYDPKKAAKEPTASIPAGPNQAAIQAVARYQPVYKVKNDDGSLRFIVLPIRGLGLWSMMYGYIAIDPDTFEVVGITYYEHGETPGLGGEVDNPNWKSRWPGRKLFAEPGEVEIEVIKGAAGPVEEDPYRVDGLAGATITARGVTHMLHFWLGEDAFGPYLEQLANDQEA